VWAGYLFFLFCLVVFSVPSVLIVFQFPIRRYNCPMDNTHLNANRAMWDELARINAGSALYDMEGFKAGRKNLPPADLVEVGEVRGKSLLHLQCHFGMDTLTWARQGAAVTGVDFSGEAIRMARALSEEVKVPARFIESNLYDLPQVLDETFDVVYTSYGVLCWLPDLTAWAQIAARYVKPGGVFYLNEFHPAALLYDDNDYPPRLAYPYFNRGVMEFATQGSYSDRSARVEQPVEYEWAHPLGEVVSSLCAAGLQIEFLHEFDFCVYEMYPWFKHCEDGFWRVPEDLPALPLQFSIRAHKPG